MCNQRGDCEVRQDDYTKADMRGKMFFGGVASDICRVRFTQDLLGQHDDECSREGDSETGESPDDGGIIKLFQRLAEPLARATEAGCD